MAWGDNSYGGATVPAGLTGVTAISAGSYGSVALVTTAQTTIGWGSNNYGQAQAPAGLTDAVALAAGYQYSLARRVGGTVEGWGLNDFGQASVPSDLADVTAIAAAWYHGVALKSDGTVAAWGRNNDGQTDVPEGLVDVKAIAAGHSFTVAVKADGTAIAWGTDDYGQTDVPAGLSGVTGVAAGIYHGLAVKSDGTVVAWGYNSSHQLEVPAGLTDVTAVSAGSTHSVALKSDGTVVAWGSNAFGESTVPAGLSNVIAIAAGGHHTLALRSNGTVVAWGDNTFGQATVPGGLLGATIIAAGNVHSLAIGSLAADAAPPVIDCAAADGLWHGTDVALACTASDTGSGLANPGDASFVLSTSVPAGTEDPNAWTGARTVCDLVGNCATAGAIGGNKIDKKAPLVSIDVPWNATYVLGQAVNASYSCTDGGSGISACTGPVASGQPIATASVGTLTFPVTGTDQVGNASSVSAAYTVAYDVCILFDPWWPVRSGAILPVVLRVCDANGHNRSASSIVLTAIGIVPAADVVSPTAASVTAAAHSDTFTYSRLLKAYVFALNTRGLSRGTYLLQFTAGADPTVHSVSFRVR